MTASPDSPVSRIWKRFSEDSVAFHHLTLLALLEGGKLAERGDMSGAPGIVAGRGGSARDGPQRTARGFSRAPFCERPPRMAADTARDLGGRPTDHVIIRSFEAALAEAVESEPFLEWHAFSLKMEYLDWMRDLEMTRHPDLFALQEERTAHVGDMELPQADCGIPVPFATISAAYEPERGRRSIRLLFANWLAEVETAGPRAQKPAVRATFFHAKHSDSVRLYSVGPEASKAARLLTPHELERWIVTSTDLRLILWNRLKPLVRVRELSGYRARSSWKCWLANPITASVVTLPPSEDALVGTYLDRLPDVGSAEIGDESTPTVVDSGTSGPPPK